MLPTVYLGAVLAAVASAAVFDDGYLGCYTSAAGMTDLGTWTYQSTGSCFQLCGKNDASYAALTKGNDCWCGGSAPAETDLVSNRQCNLECVGYPEDMCGGNDVWSIYQLEPGFSGGDDGDDGDYGDNGDNGDNSDDMDDNGDNTSTTTSAASFTVSAISIPTTSAEAWTTATGAGSASASASTIVATSAAQSLSSASTIPTSSTSGASRRYRFMFF
ncbi:hypothetical protein BO70DRAFT_382600 [Aspergillus heteromorphus CBS 117.55]|uniref:WSC domain-containing protein n=1 Tax=Aspergillus heteromorphus CBS 117.55 TaxID=1448321 RepID=A0A317V6A1_9EURO|nr:uncharacterized protein BO70DRAFT_382600 [Aspergillus heteromorphus CBS 117.55]PWY69049.1 hypothetical protein BO70DRAFT_382600 [Aspergillus heteromorphus CBS 117.55]